MIFPTIMFWMWMAAQQPAPINTIKLTQPMPYCLFLRYPDKAPKVGQIMVPCGKPHKDANGDSIQDYCWVWPKSKRRERGQ